MSKLNGQFHDEDPSRDEIEAAKVTAYALGQLSSEERVQFEARLSPEQLASMKSEAQAIQSLAATVQAVVARSDVAPSASWRVLVEQQLNKRQPTVAKNQMVELPVRKNRSWQERIVQYVAIGVVCCVLAAMLMPASHFARRSSVDESAEWHAAVDDSKSLDKLAAQYKEAIKDEHRAIALEQERINEALAVQAQGENLAEVKIAEAPKIVVTTEIEFADSLSYDTISSQRGQQRPLDLRNGGVDLTLSKRTADDAGWQASGEQYARIQENAFLSPLRQPLSTFSIDVDTASYSNVRRFLTSGQLPPADSVRIEELVNYFRYDYPQPRVGEPFSVSMEVAECPWREGHRLLRVGLKGREVPKSERPASNLVFLLDVSGSMADENKLPLLKTAMKMLVGELGEDDRVAIVTYAGEAGLKLPPTGGHEQRRITRAIDSLQSGGSTNGSAGIELAYQQATAGFITGGTNRVILCTDGDLNVGVTSDEALTKLIKQNAKSGVFLTVLGFGTGNLKDSKMEWLADNGNGLYAYIDSVREARKVLVEQLTGSTITIAKDVKIQIEFNPAQVAAYRLLGYENRVLATQDFNNDKKDAGEIGAGHTVTALYELVMVSDASQQRSSVDPLKYQEPVVRVQESGDEIGSQRSEVGGKSGELLTLKLRYKQPDGDTSQLLEYPLSDRGGSFGSASPDFQFAAAVACFGMILRGSEHRGTSNLAAVAEIGCSTLGNDPGGYRAEFVDLVRKAQTPSVR